VDDMLATLSHEEYINWLAFFDEEGFSQDRADVHHADLVATIMNSAGHRYKRQVKIKDLLPHKWETDPAKRTIEQQAEADRAFGAKLRELQGN
jgi:hypothetical protein